MNILIVDDLDTNRKLLKAVLEAENHNTIEARDGVEAMAVVEQHPVDVVISDILMPNMDGYRFCYEMKRDERYNAIPVILFTSTYTSPQDKMTALSVGADKYLLKPAPREELLSAIEEVVANAVRGPSKHGPREADSLKAYSESLVRKLGEKNAELEFASQALQTAHDKLALLNQDLEQRVKDRTSELQKALGEVKTLSGLLPICGHCKKIRDDKGYWTQIEEYLVHHSEAMFTHGVCEDCLPKYYSSFLPKAS